MQQDYKTLIIYVLTLFVIVLLIVLKKQQDHLTELEDEVVIETEKSTVFHLVSRNLLYLKTPCRGIENKYIL